MPFLPDRSHINTARLTRLALSRKVSSAPRHKEKWHPKSSFEEATLGTHCFWNKVIPVAPDPDYKTQSSVPQRQSAALSSSPSLSTSATGADCSCSSLSSADMLVSQTWIILMRSFLEHTWKLLYLPSGLHQTNRLLNSNRTFASIPFLESNSTRHEMHYLRTLAKSNDETSPTSSRYDMLSYVMTVTSKDKHHRMTAQISGLGVICAVSPVKNRCISRWASMHPMDSSCLLSNMSPSLREITWVLEHGAPIVKSKTVSGSNCFHLVNTHSMDVRMEQNAMWKKVLPEWNVWHHVCPGSGSKNRERAKTQILCSRRCHEPTIYSLTKARHQNFLLIFHTSFKLVHPSRFETPRHPQVWGPSKHNLEAKRKKPFHYPSDPPPLSILLSCLLTDIQSSQAQLEVPLHLGKWSKRTLW